MHKMLELELEIEPNSNDSNEVKSNREIGETGEENRTEAWVNNTSILVKNPLISTMSTIMCYKSIGKGLQSCCTPTYTGGYYGQ